MRLLVIGDTHGDISKVCNIIRDIKPLLYGIIHLGDVVEDVDRLRSMYPNLPIYNVCGNCDYGTNVSPISVIAFQGKKILLTHGHLFGVNFGTTKLVYKAMEVQADVCLFGHTHVPLLEKTENIYVMNPGSLTRPRGGSRASYGILKIENGEVMPSLVEYK